MPIYEYRCETGPHVRGDAAHDRRPAHDVHDLRRPGAARVPPGRGPLQGLGLLQHRLRQEEGQGATSDAGLEVGGSKSADSKSDSKPTDSNEVELVLEGTRARPRRTSPRSAACRPRPRACPRDTWMLALGSQQVPARARRSRRAAGGHVGEQRQQPGALHVGAQRLGRLPAHPRQAEERARRHQLRADRRSAPPAGGRRGRGRPRPGAHGFLRTRAKPSASPAVQLRARPCGRCSPFQKLSNGGEQIRGLVVRP